MISNSFTQYLHPLPLKKGDKIRFISPASTPRRDDIEKSAKLLRSWGFKVDFGKFAFEKLNYLAGTDEQRLRDLNDALDDKSVRAIFATRGGKGSYRIADKIDFAAAKKDPKFFVGFSDITALHLSLAKHGIGGSIHGAISIEDWKETTDIIGMPLRDMLTNTNDVTLKSDDEVSTASLTTSGTAAGIMVGGNLDMVTTTAGWGLPDLKDKILLLEAVNMYLGQVDRQLSMLSKGGYLDGVSGIALGQFTDFKANGSLTIIDLLREHLVPLDVPILGGLPLGHEIPAKRIPLSFLTQINCEERTLTVRR